MATSSDRCRCLPVFTEGSRSETVDKTRWFPARLPGKVDAGSLQDVFTGLSLQVADVIWVDRCLTGVFFIGDRQVNRSIGLIPICASWTYHQLSNLIILMMLDTSVYCYIGQSNNILCYFNKVDLFLLRFTKHSARFLNSSSILVQSVNCQVHGIDIVR